MLKIFKSHHPIRHAKSFKYAFSGILHAIVNEANFRVQILITILAIVGGIKFSITATEWALFVLSFGFLLGAELINTIVEEIIDHLIHEESECARIVKDLSAGFVLTTAITTLVILIIVFQQHVQ
ncbi:hypothetical protein A3K34_02155 [candidate division WWE3 bacterium RIFOXYC1_FULL_40_10]|uniref:Diacylglycerol kinase n=1 Tax=candidate division WWE3 bacterium RIFOXYA2_FULL_46_9 TaxID=1802636 RepID=A0A1F4W1S6_UNCKA|nr:MAG: hypothetical protein A3K58_02155 [candidate division WWE3 bacterium RIFOXYB1_FULL_40_22]OGC62195.1 MAG: hypothetical protein A3K37_02155 [candidate division WWE3 bacterium RIFOXYA1_FULL_40_11]OGC63305.1 MAG: hypothetical protein A2264_02775 [candidate division WWE3 bacterium RIFOXYA2_FULL_46_9]OGC64423.1 MAG: hypothetical protein A2326_02610 [candidate division WWE3 bacterium RIFOXYB2_FULL_41_6]OGC66578.1 MAG: hypothetical protein A3K34_02155 [candidate division WWE3 bacterium RIFOXYC1_